MQDYPAAHSMDTEWFAIDAAGNLAIFDSGENGAVPKSNREGWRLAQIEAPIEGYDDFLFEISKTLENRLVYLNIPSQVVADRFRLREGNDEEMLDREAVRGQGDSQIKESLTLSLKQPVNEWFYSDGWLLLLASNDAVTQVVTQLEVGKSEYSYAVRFAGEPPVIFVRECPAQTLQRLFQKRQVLAGKALEDYRCGIAALFGFFVYWQDSPSPLPYQRIGDPIAPLRLEDLPERLQNAVSRNKFDRLQFSETETIQPIEHTPCNTWGGNQWWIDTQGQEHDEHPKF